jgi:neutral ceramidase
MQVAAELATAMRDGTPVPLGVRPGPANRSSWQRRPSLDMGDFGRVLTEPVAEYRPGTTVRAEFVSANPNHDLRRGGTYLEVQRREGDVWVRIADDGDWSTTFRWSRSGRSRRRRGNSIATVLWIIPDAAAPGEYRIVHHGTAHTVAGTEFPFTGTTQEFKVV